MSTEYLNEMSTECLDGMSTGHLIPKDWNRASNDDRRNNVGASIILQGGLEYLGEGG